MTATGGLIRPRSGVELIDAAFVLLRAHFAPLVVLAAVPALPLLIVSVVLAARLGAAGVNQWFLLQGLLNVICHALGAAAVAVGVSDVYHGRPVDTVAALRRTVRRAWPIVGAVLLSNLLIAFGLVLLIFPGVVLFASYFAVPAVTVLENLGAGRSLERSDALSTGDRRRILATYGLTFLIATVLLAVLATLVSSVLVTRQVAATVINNALEILIAPLTATVSTLLYYDRRIRVEGYDIEMMAQQLPSESDGREPARTLPA